eukprot:symbB.v1.2.013513.t1/scaffold795.1/size259473/5
MEGESGRENSDAAALASQLAEVETEMRLKEIEAQKRINQMEERMKKMEQSMVERQCEVVEQMEKLNEKLRQASSNQNALYLPPEATPEGHRLQMTPPRDRPERRLSMASRASGTDGRRKSILGEGVGDKKRVWREQREFLMDDLFDPEVQAPARARRQSLKSDPLTSMKAQYNESRRLTRDAR